MLAVALWGFCLAPFCKTNLSGVSEHRPGSEIYLADVAEVSRDEEDVEALGKHFDKEQIVELAAAIATANFTNRINEGLKVPVDV